MEPLILTKEDSGKRIEIRQGDLIEIRLDENPTTGFRWAEDQVDEEVVVLKGKEFMLTDEPRIGQGGTRIFTYEALRSGEARIWLKHWQEWEGESSVFERFEFTAVVTE